jgi:hypothetical protein
VWHDDILPGYTTIARASGEIKAAVYLIACGLIGEPVPPVIINGGPQKKNS